MEMTGLSLINYFQNYVRFISQWKMGLRNKADNSVVIPPIFDWIDVVNNYMVSVMDAGLWGFFDIRSRHLIKCQYDEKSDFCRGVANVSYCGKCGLIDEQGTPLVPLEYDSVQPLNLFNQSIVSLNDKFGVVNKYGERIVPCVYKHIEAHNFPPYYVATDLDGTKIILGKHGREIKKSVYERKEDVLYADSLVWREGHCGIVDNNDIEILPCVYDSLRPQRIFPNSLVPACINNKWGVIDAFGKPVIPFSYEDVSLYKEDYPRDAVLTVKKDGKWGVIDREGTILIPFEYDRLRPTSISNVYYAEVGDRCCLINEIGKAILPWSPFTLRHYDIDTQPIDGQQCFSVGIRGEWGVVFSDGRVLVPFEYDEIGKDLSEGKISVRKGNYWGFYDFLRGLTIPCIYKRVEKGFANGLAIVEEAQGSMALINNDGATLERGLIITRTLVGSYIVVDKNCYPGRVSILSASGKEVGQTRYDGYTKPSGNGRFTALRGGKWGVVSCTGEEMSPFVYQYKNSYPRAFMCGLVQLINEAGEEVLVDEDGSVMRDRYGYKDDDYAPLLSDKLLKQLFGVS